MIFHIPQGDVLRGVGRPPQRPSLRIHSSLSAALPILGSSHRSIVSSQDAALTKEPVFKVLYLCLIHGENDFVTSIEPLLF